MCSSANEKPASAISASAGPWNSATTLYIARKIDEIASGAKLSVLDLGCGDGSTIDLLSDYGHDIYGCDACYWEQTTSANLEKRLGPLFRERIRFSDNEREIPFEDHLFDVIYANQVFEHVRFLDAILAECARLLKPSGTLIALFPFATYPLELHLRIPFAHWLPPGGLRIAYLRLIYGLGLRPKIKGLTARATAVRHDEFLREETFYRFQNEIENLGRHYFEKFTIETGAWIRAKLDLLKASPSLAARLSGRSLDLFDGPAADFLVTHLFGGVFVLQNPRHETAGDSADGRRGERWRQLLDYI